MSEEQKRYFYAGVFAIVFFSMVTGSVYMLSNNSAPTEKRAAKITLAIQGENSGTESFSTLIEEEALFSGKQATLTFSSKDSEKPRQITCTVHCQREGN